MDVTVKWNSNRNHEHCIEWIRVVAAIKNEMKKREETMNPYAARFRSPRKHIDDIYLTYSKRIFFSVTIGDTLN